MTTLALTNISQDLASLELAGRRAYIPAMEITNQADADAYFERCVAHTMVERPCGREEAERVERFNIGYWTGYYDRETAARVQRLFRCEHPFFGSSMADVIICEADL